MATLRVFEGESPHTTLIHFKLLGKFYQMTLDDLADIYEMNATSALPSLPAFRDAAAFFEHIADGGYHDGVRHLSIRHPALRYVTKLLANTLFSARETNVLRVRELFFLYLGLADVYPGRYREEVEIPNMGSIFVRHLVSLQTVPFESGRMTLRVGSLLTPLFVHCRENGHASSHQPEPVLLGERYLLGTHISVQERTFLFWRYTLGGMTRTVQLPRPDLTRIETRT